MVPQPDDAQTLTQANEESYDQLISLIENTQGRLAPIIVACDDEALRKRIIERYESEAWAAEIRPYRLVLGQEPSMRSGLEALKQQEPHLQRGGKAVFTVTGAEMLLRMKRNAQDEQSELDKFFGYLQWTREGLREFRYPIVLWVTHRILLELSRRAADFWSWRKAVLRFAAESPQVTQFASPESQPLHQPEDNSDAEPLPPLAELQAEIAELTAKDPDTPGLATLYNRLGQVYAQRTLQGVVYNLEQEQEHAISAFQQAIVRYQTQKNPAAEISVSMRLGSFFESQSRYLEAINQYQKSLDIAQTINERFSEANALLGLGNAYISLGQYQRVIDFYQQSLETYRKIGDRNGEGASLCNLGNAYWLLEQDQRAIDFYQQALDVQREVGNRDYEANSLAGLGNAYDSSGQHQRAIDVRQQSLEIKREIGDRYGEARCLGNLGITYYSLGQYQRAIDFHQQSLELKGKIGDRYGEALSLFNIANALAKLDHHWEALQHYQQANQVFQSLGAEHWVESCNAAIYQLNRTIPVQQSIRAPRIDDAPLSTHPSRNEIIPSRPPISLRNRRSKRIMWVYGLVGLSIVLLIWWLKR